MDIEEKLAIVQDIVGRPLTANEEAIALELLASPLRQYGSSNSPTYVARRLMMLEKAA